MYETKFFQSETNIDLFDRITSNNRIKSSQEIIVSLKSKRALIRQMLFKEVEKKKIIIQEGPLGTTKTSFTLCDLIKNMGRYLFGENGLLTNKIPYLKKEYVRLRNIRKLQFQEKINVGDLTYYNIDRTKSRLDEVKRNWLAKSLFFFVPSQEVDYLNSHQPSPHQYPFKYNQLEQSNKKKKKKQGSASCLKQCVLNQYHNKHKGIKTDERFRHTETSSPIDIKEGLTTQRNHSQSHQHCTINRAVIDTKLDIIHKKQTKLQKKLFKIIDKASLSSKKHPLIKKRKTDNSINKLFNLNIKYKKKSTRDVYMETIRTRNSTTMIDPIKAKLLRLSDSIHHLNNTTALVFADSILTEYSDASKRVTDCFIERKSEVASTKDKHVEYNAFQRKRKGLRN